MVPLNTRSDLNLIYPSLSIPTTKWRPNDRYELSIDVFTVALLR